MRKRVRVTWRDDAWRVDLPTYVMVLNSFLPVITGVTSSNGVLPEVDPATPALSGLTCLVDIADDYAASPTSPIDVAMLRQRHAGHPRYGNPSWTPEV